MLPAHTLKSLVAKFDRRLTALARQGRGGIYFTSEVRAAVAKLVAADQLETATQQVIDAVWQTKMEAHARRSARHAEEMTVAGALLAALEAEPAGTTLGELVRKARKE